MARIRSTDTGPELALRRELHRRGLRYALNKRLDFGRPDLVFPARRALVFVDGCFWHGCPDHYVAPRSKTDFWSDKLRDNVRRDQRQTKAAELAGWTVVRVWEHDVRTDVVRTADWVSAAILGARLEPHPHWQVLEVAKGQVGSARRTLVELRDLEPPRTIDAIS